MKISGTGGASEEEYFWTYIPRYNPNFICETASRCHSPTSKESSYIKNEYNLLYNKLNADFSFIRQFFWKNAIFSKKTAKNCFRGAFDHFLGKAGILPQKLI